MIEQSLDHGLGFIEHPCINRIFGFARLAGIFSRGDHLCPGMGQHIFDDRRDFLHFRLAHAQGSHGRRAKAQAAGVPGAVGVEGEGVAIHGQATVAQDTFGLSPGQVKGAHIHQQEMVVGSAAGDHHVLIETGLGQAARIFDNFVGISFEFESVGLRQGNGLGRHQVGSWPTHGNGAALIYLFGKIGGR